MLSVLSFEARELPVKLTWFASETSRFLPEVFIKVNDLLIGTSLILLSYSFVWKGSLSDCSLL